MKILVDMHAFSADQWTGKHVYTLGLIKKMLRQNDDLELVLAVAGQISQEIEQHPRLSIVHLSTGVAFYFNFFKLALTDRYAAILSPTSFITSLLSPLPTITVIYDLAVYQTEFAKNTKAEVIEKILLPLITIKSQVIITISQAVKDELVVNFPVTRNKLKVSLPTPRNFPVAAKNVLSRYGLQSQQYYLYVGTLEPRKNLLTLFKAYHGMIKLLAKLGKPTPQLVIAGGTGWKSSSLFQYIKQHGLHRNIKLLGYIPDEDLPELYQHCYAVTYIPWYEGFGLPVAEASLFGTVCITSNKAALKEAATGARLLIDPSKVRQISLVLLALWQHKKLRNYLAR